jgi:hypothetical protein
MRNATMFSTCQDAVHEVDAAEFELPGDAEHANPDARIGAIETSRPRARRGYSMLKGRRTRFQSKRRTGKLTSETAVHRGEREIIARN